MNEFLLVLGMAAVTFGVRYPVLAILGRLRLPEPVLRVLRYVPVAVLTAIISVAVMMPDGRPSPWLSLNNAHLVGAVVAVVMAWRTRNLLATILVGMVVFLLWRNLVG